MISEFFENKKSKLAPEVGFKSVLESAPVTHKAFKKKQQISMIKEENAGNMVREEDYNRMKNDNHDLKRRLQ